MLGFLIQEDMFCNYDRDGFAPATKTGGLPGEGKGTLVKMCCRKGS